MSTRGKSGKLLEKVAAALAAKQKDETLPILRANPADVKDAKPAELLAMLTFRGGSDPGHIHADGRSLLFFAILGGHLEAMEWLQKRGVDYTSPVMVKKKKKSEGDGGGEDAWYPLTLAASLRRLDVFAALLEGGADPFVIDPLTQSNVLHVALEQGTAWGSKVIGVLNRAIGKGSVAKLLTSVNKSALTPFMMIMAKVSTTGDLAVLEELFRGLISKELFTSTRTGNGTTLFHTQANRGPGVIEENVLSFLVQWMGSEDILAEDYTGKTPLDIFMCTIPGARGVLQRELKLRDGGGSESGANSFSKLVATPELSRKRELASFEDVWQFVEKTFSKEIEDKAAALSFSHRFRYHRVNEKGGALSATLMGGISLGTSQSHLWSTAPGLSLPFILSTILSRSTNVFALTAMFKERLKDKKKDGEDEGEKEQAGKGKAAWVGAFDADEY